MKVELSVLDLGLLARLVDVPHVFLAQKLFALGLQGEQIDHEAITVRARYILKVKVKSFPGHFEGTRQIDVFFDAALLPEHRERAADLRVRDQKLIRDQHLLLLALISDVAKVVYAAGVVARSRSVVDPA